MVVHTKKIITREEIVANWVMGDTDTHSGEFEAI